MIWHNIKKWPFRYRKISLALAALLGILFAATWQISGLGDFLELDDRLNSSLTLLLLGLPTFFLLWVFRTHDVQRQLDKTQESINNSTFFECARLLADEKTFSKRAALEQLANLKNETGFNNARIDLLTSKIFLSRGLPAVQEKMPDFRLAQFKSLDLSHSNLSYIILWNADLRGADLKSAKLMGADLMGADLRGADLSWADLTGTDLSDTDLRGADLNWADLTDTNMKDGYYNSETTFPTDFVPIKAGMIPKPD